MIKGTTERGTGRREEIMNACQRLYRIMSFREITIKEIGAELPFSRPTMRLFFPFIPPDFRKRGEDYVWETEDKNEIAFAMTFKTEPQAMVMSFMHNYGERYDWLCKLFKDWAFLALTPTYYMEDKQRGDPDTIALFRKAIAAFDGNAPTYHIELWDKPTLVWDFHSLLLDIRFLLSTMLTDDQTPLRICKQCHKPFIASSPDENCCSESCEEDSKK